MLVCIVYIGAVLISIYVIMYVCFKKCKCHGHIQISFKFQISAAGLGAVVPVVGENLAAIISEKVEGFVANVERGGDNNPKAGYIAAVWAMLVLSLVVRQLRYQFSGGKKACFTACPPRSVCVTGLSLRLARAYRVLIGACNPTVCRMAV